MPCSENVKKKLKFLLTVTRYPLPQSLLYTSINQNRTVMRNLKVLFFAVVMCITTSVLATTVPDFRIEKSVTSEIEEMLNEANFTIEEELSVRVVFSLSDERKIIVHSIKSENTEVNDFLMERLQGKQVLGGNWKTGKYYALPVKVEAVK